MRFVFFDIECANCFNNIGKICEFGYVITDENFKVIYKDEIPMSPGKGKENRFYLKGRKNREDLELAYDESFYFSQNEFPHFYNEIKKILGSEDTICFAYAMENDISYITSTCNRYHLPIIEFKCYDIQELVRKYYNSTRNLKLKVAAEKLVGPHCLVNIQQHLSRDDAYLTMEVFEAICALKNKTSLEILEEEKSSIVNNIHEYCSNLLRRSEIAKEKEIERRNKKTINETFEKYFKENEELIPLENYAGKKYAISGFAKKDLETLNSIIDKFKQRKLKLVRGTIEADIMIVDDEESIKLFNEKTKGKFDGEFILLKDFLN